MSRQSSGNIQEIIEDHALQRVPEQDRQSWFKLSWNTMGIVSTLVILLIGALVSFTAGAYLGIVAALIATVISSILGSLVGNIAFKQGLSSSVLSRYHGLGIKGSILASVIYGFMIIGFLALENALLYEGILFYFKMQPTLANAVVIYGVLSITWILLATFGIKLVSRVSSVMTVAFLVILAYMIFNAVSHSEMTIGQILSYAPIFPGGTQTSRFIIAINMLIGTAGSIALVAADFSRYAKSSRDVVIIASLGSLMQTIGMFFAGTIIMYLGFDTVQKYYVDGGMAVADAAGAALNNVGATFIILAGLTGTILMLVAQSKAQVLNTYSSSLSLSNLFDTVELRPGRLFMVILANVIAMLMIIGNILGLINSWLTILGVMTTCLAVIMVGDYYIVQKRSVSLHKIEAEMVNWAGVITLVLGTVAAMLLQKTVPIPFVTSSVISIVLYPLLRTYVFKPSINVQSQQTISFK